MGKFINNFSKFILDARKTGDELFEECEFKVNSLTDHNSTGVLINNNGECFNISLVFNNEGKIVSSSCSCGKKNKCEHIYAYLKYLDKESEKSSNTVLIKGSIEKIELFLYKKGFRKVERNFLSSFLTPLANTFDPSSIAQFLFHVLRNWVLNEKDSKRIISFLLNNIDFFDYKSVLNSLLMKNNYHYRFEDNLINALSANKKCAELINALVLENKKLSQIGANVALGLIENKYLEANNLLLSAIFENLDEVNSYHIEYYPGIFLDGDIDNSFFINFFTEFLYKFTETNIETIFNAFLNANKLDLLAHHIGLSFETPHLKSKILSLIKKQDRDFKDYLAKSEILKENYRLPYALLKNTLASKFFDESLKISTVTNLTLTLLINELSQEEIYKETEDLTLYTEKFDVAYILNIIRIFKSNNIHPNLIKRFFTNSNFLEFFDKECYGELSSQIIEYLDKNNLLHIMKIYKGVAKCF